jgi:hypothetical protein
MIIQHFYVALLLPLLRLPGGVKMQHCQGQRCQATRSIRGHQGFVTAHTQGTIEAEISNLGRHLIAVRWDNGLQMYVFPDEIEIGETSEEWVE